MGQQDIERPTTTLRKFTSGDLNLRVLCPVSRRKSLNSFRDNQRIVVSNVFTPVAMEKKFTQV